MVVVAVGDVVAHVAAVFFAEVAMAPVVAAPPVPTVPIVFEVAEVVAISAGLLETNVAVFVGVVYPCIAAAVYAHLVLGL